MAHFDVVVLGSGVIGLSTALELQQAGYKVAIVAKDLAEDVDSSGFASPWAGCIWQSLESDPDSRVLKWDRRTFERLAQVAKTRPDLCENIEFAEIYRKSSPEVNAAWRDLMDDYREVTREQEKLPGNYPHAHRYKSYVMNAPKYLGFLSEMAASKGIPIIRKRLTALDEAYALPSIGPVDLVVNATGLGAQKLMGVEDHAVYPIQGQTVLVRAPEVRMSIMRKAEKDAGTDTPPAAYIIPRPGSGGLVICGGIYEEHNYSVLPDRTKAEGILKECFGMEPKLAPGGTSWRDIEVVSVNVGLRPARVGGARVELEKRRIAEDWSISNVFKPVAGPSRDVAVIHAYGFGGAGYIGSLGAAEEVVRIAKQYKSEIPKARL